MSTPLVSICCLTYNHENYIQDAIEGFLMQQVDFPIEIIIHDDASTDRTAEIIREYEEKYPDIIKPIYQNENQWSKGIKPSPTYVWPKALGKYIALCEGDDYWTDPLKLKKQVEFMEKNEGYSLIVGGHERIDEETGIKKRIIKDVNSADNGLGYSFTLMDFTKGWITKTLTALFRKSALQNINYDQYQYFRDVHLFYHILKNGLGFYMTDILGIYRIHARGIFSTKMRLQKKQINYYVCKELYEVNKDRFTRVMYLGKIKGLLKTLDYGTSIDGLSKLSLIKTALYLIKDSGELLSLIKSLTPILNSIEFRGKLSVK